MKQLFIIAMLPLAMASCIDEALNEESVQDCNQKNVYSTLVGDTTMDVSYEDAVLMAKSMVKDVESRTKITSAWDVKTITDEEGPVMYVINYPNNGGFVVISAKRSYYPILAQSETGYLDIGTGTHMGLNDWIEAQKRLISNSANINDEQKASIASLWMRYNKKSAVESRAQEYKPQVYYDSLMKWTMAGYYDVYRLDEYMKTQEYESLSEQDKHDITVNVHTFGNGNYGSVESTTIVLRREYSDIYSDILLKTNWNYSDGFGKYLSYPNLLSLESVAIGQIAKYHEYPDSYQWGEMDDTVANDVTAQFLAIIERWYNLNSITESELDRVLNVFGILGYKKSEIDPSNKNNSLKNEIKSRNPVFVNCSKKSVNNRYNYSWLYDGLFYGSVYLELRFMTLEYRPTAYKDPDVMIEAHKVKDLRAYYPMLFHINWGFGGKSNGFYAIDDVNYTISGEKVSVPNEGKHAYSFYPNR